MWQGNWAGDAFEVATEKDEGLKATRIILSDGTTNVSTGTSRLVRPDECFHKWVLKLKVLIPSQVRSFELVEETGSHRR